MQIQQINNLDDPYVSAYRDIRDADLKRREGLFIAEGRYVLSVLLGPQSLHRPRSIFLTPAALEAMGDQLDSLDDQPPVYVAEQELMNSVVGFDIHRGCLAAGERGEERVAEQMLGEPPQEAPSLVVALEGLNNHDNIGGIFRNAAAFAADAVLLDPRCADPLYRKAIRVSMGAALITPWGRFADWPSGLDSLRTAGFTTLALTPVDDAIDISDARAALGPNRRIALLLGEEGPGLSKNAMESADLRVRIPISARVDSLNVATTAGIALNALSPLKSPPAAK